MQAHRRLRRGATPALATAALLATFLAASCSLPPDDQCSAGEFPVKGVGNKTGGTCVKNGDKVPAGYVRYPAGKVPEKVGDKWDEYWGKVIVDKDGHLVGKSKNVPVPK